MDKGKINVLITGGLGFIGWNLAMAMLKDGRFNINIVDKKNTNFNDINCEGICVYGGLHTKNIGKTDMLLFYVEDGMDIEEADVIIHLGEFARVEQSLDGNICEVLEDNVVGTARLLQEYVNVSPNAIFIYAGSSTRFSWGKAYEQSPYAFTKYMNAELVRMMGIWFGVRTFTTYFYNVFGERENKDSQYGTVIGRFAEQYHKGEKIEVYGGAQTRRFTYIGDVTRNMMMLVSNLLVKDNMPKSFHFVSKDTDEISINKIAKMFYDDDMIIYKPERAGCRQQSISDDMLSGMNTYGEYNTSVSDYVKKVKVLRRWI